MPIITVQNVIIWLESTTTPMEPIRSDNWNNLQS